MELEIVDKETGEVTPYVPLSGGGLTAIKQTLKDFKVTTKAEAIKMLAFISITNNEAAIKGLKEKCYSFLQNRCNDCENAIDTETGIEVTKVEKNTNVFNESAEVDKIKAEMEKLKEKLKKAQEKAGISHTNTSVYYKVKL